MTTMEIRPLSEAELEPGLFRSFNRYQKVTRCYRKHEGSWVLKDIPFTEDWGPEEYAYLVQCLKNTVATGGIVLGAFEEDTLVGFASLESERFGKGLPYLQLSSLHVSHEHRSMGIGRRLFQEMILDARRKGAEKLYISAHSSEETQNFYRTLGCVEAEEYNEKLTAEEPFDCQLEYIL
ncbi:GNAT family N-acetyltransferase [Proteiniclasticum sp. C24MP]|uniref:GNAT family N-acetyltransferase n=1 Tax=Proteiniclasticum sp. C24MP TaxID=3374101 RepID=UPI003754BB0E